MKLKTIKLKNPKNYNLIFGQSHFIKTVEDLHETLIGQVPNAKFGLAFAEASGPRLIRTSGTDKELIKLAANNISLIGAGHSFLIFLKDSFPINFLNNIKQIQEICQIYCATANNVEVIVAKTTQGSAILGVVDGGSPLGIENKKQQKIRLDFLRKIGYKL